MKNVVATLGTVLSLFVILSFGVFGGSALADDHYKGGKNKQYIIGTVESIDASKMTFTVANSNGAKTLVVVAPSTEFEVERGKGIMGDYFVTFSDLRPSDWVKVKSYQTLNNGPMADEVEIYR